MTVIADYTEEEQRLLRSAVQAAAVAIAAASPGRREETVSEGYAAAEFILGSQPDYVDNSLVTSMLVQLQTALAHEQVFPDFVAVASTPGASERAMDVLGQVRRLLAERADPEEAMGFKRWLLDIARVTAQAGMEDQGFLGRGGVLVNDLERAACEAMAEVLGVEAPGT